MEKINTIVKSQTPPHNTGVLWLNALDNSFNIFDSNSKGWTKVECEDYSPIIEVSALPDAEESKDKIVRLSTDNKLYVSTESDGEYFWAEVVNSKNFDSFITVVETTYQELKSLRDNSQLVAGQQYRITDYVTTTAQENTQSAGHAFDIIVVADSENVLNENARAIQHSGDTYFENCNLDSWELKYCIDNDDTRFAWADSTKGKGVVYNMKDEWGNECPYDFKNIQFKRFAITEYDKVPSLVVDDDENYYGYYYGAIQLDGESQVIGDAVYGEDFEWLYTFALKDLAAGTWHDYTVVAHLGLKNDDGNEVTCYGNKLSQCRDEYNSGAGNLVTVLNDVVFMNCYSDLSDTESSDDYSYCNSNVLGDNCYSNTFGNDCGGNTFGNNNNNNTFGNYCYNNTFGNNIWYNTFGNDCYHNTFGNSCYSNTFGNYCQWNTFGNDCGGNTFGNSCSSNTFGNGIGSNTFGNYCYNNTFGNYCQYNTFGNDYIRNCSFGDGVKYCSITVYTTSDSVYLQHIIVLNGTQGTMDNLLELSGLNTNVSYSQTCGTSSSGVYTHKNILD